MQRTIYTTLSGNEVIYDEPSPEVAAFIKRAQALLENKKSTENDLITLVYGPENPILSRHPLFPNRGYVTREALENPIYLVLADMVVQKHAQRERVDISKLSDRYSLTIPEAFRRIKVTDTTIRKAIASGRLSTFRRNGKYFLDPAEVDALIFGERGSVVCEPLEVAAGGRPRLFLHVRIGQHEAFGAGTELQSATFKRWRKVGVLSGNASGIRMFVIEPAEEKEAIRLGKYHVEGHFRIVDKVNNSAAARKAWKEFRAV